MAQADTARIDCCIFAFFQRTFCPEAEKHIFSTYIAGTNSHFLRSMLF